MGSGSRVEKVFLILPNKTVVAAGTLLKPSMQISPEARRSRSRHRPRSPWEAAALRRRLVGRGEDGGAGAAGCGRVRAAAAAHGPTGACPLEGGDLWRVVTMDLAYVCEWEKWPKSTHCPSVPLACAWSCRNLIAFTTDLRNDDQGASPRPRPSPLLTQAPTVPGALQWGNSRVSRSAWEAPPSCLGPLGACSFVTGVVRTPAPQGCKGRTCSTDGCCPLRASRLTAGS